MDDIKFMQAQVNEHFKFRNLLAKITLKANVITFIIIVAIIGIDVLKYMCR